MAKEKAGRSKECQEALDALKLLVGMEDDLEQLPFDGQEPERQARFAKAKDVIRRSK